MINGRELQAELVRDCDRLEALVHSGGGEQLVDMFRDLSELRIDFLALACYAGARQMRMGRPVDCSDGQWRRICSVSEALRDAYNTAIRSSDSLLTATKCIAALDNMTTLGREARHE